MTRVCRVGNGDELTVAERADQMWYSAFYGDTRVYFFVFKGAVVVKERK